MLNIEINFAEEHKVLTTLAVDAIKQTVGVQFKGTPEFFESLTERTCKGKNGEFIVYVQNGVLSNTGYQLSKELVDDGVEFSELAGSNIFARYEWTKDESAIGGEGWLTIKFTRHKPTVLVDSCEEAIKKAKEVSTKKRDASTRTASALERIAALGLKL